MVTEKSITRSCWTSVLVILTFAAGVAYADTFEFLSFTPPPGWAKQAANNQTVYRRPSGVGMISFIPSYQTVGLPADEFAKIWSGHVGTTLRGPTPPAQTERIGNYTVAIGGTKVNAQGERDNDIADRLRGTGPCARRTRNGGGQTTQNAK